MKFFSNIFKRREKESRVAKLRVSSTGGPIQSEKDYYTFAKETYLKNIIGFACIREIAQACSMVPWRLKKRISSEESELVYDHELNRLLVRPNPESSFNNLIYRSAAFLSMAGNTFFEQVKLSTRQAAYPAELYVLRPDKIKLISGDSGRLAAYEYMATNSGDLVRFEIDPITRRCDLLHIALFHPTDDFWGASATETAARELDTSNDATDWNLSLVQNQGRPGMAVTLIGDIADDEWDRIERQLDEKFSGKNVGKNLILAGENGTKVEPYGLTFADLEWTEGSRELARRIALAYGVPPQLLGIPGDSTYNNQKEARLAFHETTIDFYLNYLKCELNNWIFHKDIPTKDKGLYFSYSLDGVSALEERLQSKYNRAQESDFLTINEKRDMVGKEKLEYGDVILVDAGKIPLEIAIEQPELDDGDKKLTEEEKQLVMGLRENWNE